MRRILLLAVLAAPSCVVAVAETGTSGIRGEPYEGRTGLRVEYATWGSYDSDFRGFEYPNPVVRQSADFDVEGLGVAFEHFFSEYFSVVAALRQRDVENYRGNMPVDDTFQEIAFGGRAHLPLDAGFSLFGEFGLVVLTGLDTTGANTLPGAALGAGAAWRLHEHLSLEVLARYVSAVTEDEDGWFFREKTELEGAEIVFGLTYWF